jgi:hypothetical protein
MDLNAHRHALTRAVTAALTKTMRAGVPPFKIVKRPSPLVEERRTARS